MKNNKLNVKVFMAIVKRLLTKVNKGLSGCKHAVGAIVRRYLLLKRYQ